MRNVVCNALAAVAIFAAVATPGLAQEPATPAALAIGATAPMRTTRMRGVDDRSVSIADVAGPQGTLVVFTCNHCPWAQAWEARLTALGNQYRARGIGVIAINSNDPAQHAEDGFEEMQRRARAAGMQFPYVVDATSGVARAFGATRTPEVFLFDRRGHLAYHGAIDDNAHEPDQVQQHSLRDALAAVVAGRAPATPETRSVGCTIKLRP